MSPQESEKIKRPTQQGSRVRCPECGNSTRVLNSVPRKENTQGRYRECDSCGLRMYSEEKIVRLTTKLEEK